MTYREQLPGGAAAGMSPSDFDRGALREGTKVEMEHTTSKKVAREIAMDHLAEDPQYYVKLRAIHTHNPGRSKGMTYDQIKKELAAAGRLVDRGKVAEADRKIRAMVGKGLTRADLDANLTSAQMAALRKGAKGNPGALYHKTQAYNRAIGGAQWLTKATEARGKKPRFDAAAEALMEAQSGITEQTGVASPSPKLARELRRIRREALKIMREAQ